MKIKHKMSIFILLSFLLLVFFYMDRKESNPPTVSISVSESDGRVVKNKDIIMEVGISSSTDIINMYIDQETVMGKTENKNKTKDINRAQASMLIAGGCFWCVEADVEKLSGVISAVSGYAGGTNENPTYENYGKAGHREVVEITYDPNIISYEEILIYAMKHMDPTDDKGSFADRGAYYTPAFYYNTDKEKKIVETLIKEVDEKGPYDRPLAVAVEKSPKFWPAEDYHQDYYKKSFSSLKYKYYRNASGRDDFIKKYWGDDVGPTLPWRINNTGTHDIDKVTGFWKDYKKPSVDEIKKILTPLQFHVTQENGTERPFDNSYDKLYEDGIYVDVLSGEPLYSSTDKYDSSTGWPSFVRPISDDAVTKHIDKKLFSTRTEIRSAIADNHIGHVFSDGPVDRGGLRYCMNSAAMTFVPRAEMEEKGYGEYLKLFE